MINLKCFFLTVNFLSLCVKFSISDYDSIESFEVVSTLEDETITTSKSTNDEDEYPNEDVTTTVDDITTTAEDHVNITNPGNKQNTEIHIGRVYQILESIINDGISVRSLNKTEQKPIFKVYEAFEDDTTDEIATVPFEVTTNIAVDYVDKTTLQEVSDEMLIEDSGKNVTTSICPHFIYSPSFKMDKMADVWHPVYYDLQDKLICFKIQIKKTSEEEREQYEQRYGNYNESMNWKECHFEIKSSAVKYRKHFLQGVVGDLGVMRNIILVQNKNGDFDLQEENSDQWLMLKNLLILRDCQTGGIIAFARVPYHPRKSDIVEALDELGVKMMGKSICNS